MLLCAEGVFTDEAEMAARVGKVQTPGAKQSGARFNRSHQLFDAARPHAHNPPAPAHAWTHRWRLGVATPFSKNIHCTANVIS